MANTHEVTVHIWTNNDLFETWLDTMKRNSRRPEGCVTGHAALKLQRIGADKGEYLYLSMLPNLTEILGRKARQAHNLAVRYGPGSAAAAQGLPPEKQNFLGTTQLGKIDKEIDYIHGQPGKANWTYRINGLAFAKMDTFIRKLAEDLVAWHMHDYNCADAVAACLKAGNAPPMDPEPAKFTPNRVGAWCDALCRAKGGQIKNGQTGEIVFGAT